MDNTCGWTEVNMYPFLKRGGKEEALPIKCMLIIHHLTTGSMLEHLITTKFCVKKIIAIKYKEISLRRLLDETNVCLCVCLMVFNAIFINISVISWWSGLLVEKTGVPGKNH